MNKEILISLPTFRTNCGDYNAPAINLKLIDLVRQYPEKFYDNIKIDSVYDSFLSIWGGGRAMPGCGFIPTKEIEKMITPFLERGIEIRYNFTNCLLEPKHLLDANCNHIVRETLRIMKPYGAKLRIVINSSLLKNYLEKTYPELLFIYSTTLDDIGLEKINNYTKKDMLVLGYNYNNDFNFLKQLAHPENIEVLANEHCFPHCPYRQYHFRLYSAVQLGRISDDLYHSLDIPCPNRIKENKTKIWNKRIKTDSFINDYLPLGINKLKIVGRNTPKEDLIRDYCLWLVKPEYENEIKKLLRAA